MRDCAVALRRIKAWVAKMKNDNAGLWRVGPTIRPRLVATCLAALNVKAPRGRPRRLIGDPRVDALFVSGEPLRRRHCHLPVHALILEPFNALVYQSEINLI